MKRSELRHKLDNTLNELKKLSYHELCGYFNNPKTYQYGEKEYFYQVEIESFWDDPRGKSKNLHVIVAIDDGGVRAFFPISDSFIIAEDGRLL